MLHKHDGRLPTMGYHPIYPDDPYHPDNPCDVHEAEVKLDSAQDGAFVLIEGGYGNSEHSTMHLDAKQALSLLAWLIQEKATLEKMAKEQEA